MIKATLSTKRKGNVKMAQYQDVFKRIEKKYLLSAQQHQALMQQLQGYMSKDKHGQHTICNLYFDTESYELIRHSIEKPLYKEKLRLRSYGVPKASDTVFLELKKKFEGIVYKRRISLSLEEARRYLLYKEKPRKESQILCEIDWFLMRYQPVPKIYIAYDRIALYSNEDTSLRITFDQNILFRESLLDLSKGNWGKSLLKPGNVLMEIKIPGAMPLWLSRLLTGLEIYPTPFSKYGNVYRYHLLHQVFPKGGIVCA